MLIEHKIKSTEDKPIQDTKICNSSYSPNIEKNVCYNSQQDALASKYFAGQTNPFNLQIGSVKLGQSQPSFKVKLTPKTSAQNSQRTSQICSQTSQRCDQLCGQRYN